MNKVIFMHQKPVHCPRPKTVPVLILIAAVVVPSGIIFRSSWLSWIGLTLIGVACLWLLIAELRALFLPWPRYRLVQVNSKPMLDEFLRLGWTLREERRELGHDESCEYLLEWLREEDPPRADMSKISDPTDGR